MAVCDVTYNELRSKDVINICDCKKLGRICDIVIDLRTGRIRGIVLPGSRGFNIFKAPDDIFIPWKKILRIGNDVILVEIFHKLRDCKEKHCDGDKEGDDCGIKSEIFDSKIRPKVLKYLCGDDEDDE